MEIPYIKLTDGELAENCRIMIKGNTLLRDCANSANIGYKKFRILLFSKKFTLSKDISHALPFIKAVRNIEWNMLCGFSQCVRKKAESWSRHNRNTTYDDCLQEGYMALVDSIYNYIDPNIKFITFAMHNIHVRLIDTYNKSNPFCPLTNQARKLIKLFKNKKKFLNDNVNDEQIIQSLDLSDDEKDIIRSVLVNVHSVSQLLLPEYGDDHTKDYENDYSCLERGIEREKPAITGCKYRFVNYDGDTVMDHDLIFAIQQAKLNKMELRIIETYMTPYYGWQEDIAKQFLNPNSGKRYTRQSVAVMLTRILNKIKRIYLKGAA